jgi:hypothetical protein
MHSRPLIDNQANRSEPHLPHSSHEATICKPMSFVQGNATAHVSLVGHVNSADIARVSDSAAALHSQAARDQHEGLGRCIHKL